MSCSNSQKKTENLFTFGPFGGPNGVSWDDGLFTNVRTFIIFHGRAIDSLKIEYVREGTCVWTEKHGGNGGNKIDMIKLQYPHEFLTGISTQIGIFNSQKVLRSLTFYSNRSKYGPYGGQGGSVGQEEYFNCHAPQGKIVGFHGRCSNYLDAIGVHIEHNSSINLLNGWADTKKGFTEKPTDTKEDANNNVYSHDQSTVPETVQQERRETTSAQTLDTFEGAAEQPTASLPAQALTPERDSYRKCVEVLQEMKQLDDEEFKAAMNFLKDDKMAIAFLTLKGRRRKIWLLSSIDNLRTGDPQHRLY